MKTYITTLFLLIISGCASNEQVTNHKTNTKKPQCQLINTDKLQCDVQTVEGDKTISFVEADDEFFSGYIPSLIHPSLTVEPSSLYSYNIYFELNMDGGPGFRNFLQTKRSCIAVSHNGSVIKMNYPYLYNTSTGRKGRYMRFNLTITPESSHEIVLHSVKCRKEETPLNNKSVSYDKYVR